MGSDGFWWTLGAGSLALCRLDGTPGCPQVPPKLTEIWEEGEWDWADPGRIQSRVNGWGSGRHSRQLLEVGEGETEPEPGGLSHT